MILPGVRINAAGDVIAAFGVNDRPRTRPKGERLSTHGPNERRSSGGVRCEYIVYSLWRRRAKSIRKQTPAVMAVMTAPIRLPSMPLEDRIA